jgi:hypothetical protein
MLRDGRLPDDARDTREVFAAAYGTRLYGELPVQSLTVWGAARWPTLEVVLEVDPLPGPSERSLSTTFGNICLDEQLQRARLPVPEGCSPDMVVHPLLSTLAWMRARLLGQEVLHAGAFLGEGGGAWLVLADKGAGKSTLLSMLHQAGCPVVTDDLAILDNGRVYAGPRCIDLRPDMAARWGLGRPVRDGDRYRVDLPPVGAEHEVVGVMELDWSAEARLTTVAPAERLARLLEASGRRPRRDARELLDLATLPYYCLSRPADAADALGLLPDEVRVKAAVGSVS